jgi:hypothetical protein
MEELMAKMASLSEKKADETGAEPSEEDAAKLAELKKQMEEAKAKEDELAKKAEDAAKKGTSTGGTSAKKETAKKTDDGTKVAAAEKPAKASSKKADEEPAPTKKASTSELDSLLGGDKEEVKEPTKKAAPSLPATPSKADVTAAMTPVQTRAQASCAKYSTGTVQVQVLVDSNGRVKNATPKGAFAGNQAGQCVAMMARSAKFPKFSDPTYSFLYPIILK